MKYTIAWVIITVASLIVEVLTISLASIWFVVGGGIALILSLCGFSFVTQLIVFVVVSLASLSIFWSLRKKLKITSSQIPSTNADRLIGERGLVTIEINPFDNTGEVVIKGQLWSALSKDNERLEKDTRIEVVGFSSVRAIVKKIEIGNE